MEASSFLLPRPHFDQLPEMGAAFDKQFQETPSGAFIEYSLQYPKWQFLSYLCETRDLILHGSQNLEIEQVEPQQANDKRAYSNQFAIYATTDGIWVMYFAIVDRKKYPKMTLFNSCLQARISPDELSELLYFFSITHSVLIQKPWCTGAIYILPRQSFSQESAQQVQETEIIFPHWISTQPAQPIAKLLVTPVDFPFLDQIHGHHDEKLIRLSSTNPNGFPWPEALES
ncbi:MAG: hypothetical protein IH585_04065 [Anaerolineaceae bacterium]|nr:hypothetical protein [Anaerolineaceae bacterium]